MNTRSTETSSSAVVFIEQWPIAAEMLRRSVIEGDAFGYEPDEIVQIADDKFGQWKGLAKDMPLWAVIVHLELRIAELERRL